MPSKDLRAQTVDGADLRRAEIPTHAPPHGRGRRCTDQVGLQGGGLIGSALRQSVDALPDAALQLRGRFLGERDCPEASCRQRLGPAHPSQQVQAQRHQAMRLPRTRAGLDDGAARQ